MFAKAKLPKSNEASFSLREKPFTLPEPEGAAEEFVVILRPDAPFDFCTLGGMGIHKNTMPVAFSLTESQGKVFQPTVLVRELTANQLKAVKEEANKRIIHIPARLVSKNGEEERYSEAKDACLGDYLYIVPSKTYNPLTVNFAGTIPEEVNKDNVMAYQAKKTSKDK